MTTVNIHDSFLKEASTNMPVHIQQSRHFGSANGSIYRRPRLYGTKCLGEAFPFSVEPPASSQTPRSPIEWPLLLVQVIIIG